MLTRLFGAFTVSSLILIFTASSLFAQDTPAYCGQLDAADCALLASSAEAMQDIQSVETESTMLLSLTDFPNMPFEELNIRYDQYSSVSIKPETLAFLKEFQGMTMLELEERMSSPLYAFEYLETILTGMDLSVEMDLELSDELLDLINEQVRSEFGVDLPADLGLALKFVDGIVYLDMTTIAAMVPEIGMFVQGWVGVDSAPLLEMAMSEMAAAGIDEDFQMDSTSELTNNPFAGLSMNQTGPLVTVADELDPTDESATYLSIERLEDAGATEENVVAFRTTIDYNAFLKSNAFRELVYAIMTQDGATATADQLDETVTLAQIMAPPYLADLQMEVVEQIAADNAYMVGGEFSLDWDLKAALMTASLNDPSLQPDADGNPYFSLNTLTSNHNVNQELTIEPPDGAFVIPLEMLMALMNS
ncbi:MAG: hypothetical protein AAF702_50895 [Chloroflexota bacterium]